MSDAIDGIPTTPEFRDLAFAAIRARYSDGTPWPTALVCFHLRVLAGERVAGTRSAREWPSIRALAREWNWNKDKVSAFTCDTDNWIKSGDPAVTIDFLRGVRTSDVDIANDEDGALFEMPGPLTHADVVQRAVRWLRGHHKCNPVYAEIVTYERVNPDAIGFRKAAGSTRAWSVLVEAKISRSDFRADQDKIIHRLPDSCPGQERWYLTPPNLLRASEIPDGWGLAECGARSVRIVKAAPHGDPVPERMHADMGILVAAARRHRIGVKWNDDTAKFAPYSSATEDE